MMNNQPNYDRILVAMDFSPYAAAALKQAVWLARQTGVQIVLAHTIPDLSKSVYWGPYEREMNQRELRDRSDTAMRRMIMALVLMLNHRYRQLKARQTADIQHE